LSRSPGKVEKVLVLNLDHIPAGSHGELPCPRTVFQLWEEALELSDSLPDSLQRCPGLSQFCDQPKASQIIQPIDGRNAIPWSLSP
jgi:hypothetical protein